MKNELVIKKCMKCGAIVRVINEGGCPINCCGEEMKVVKPNSVDAAAEKHVPVYEVNGDMIKVSVNHVMEDDHYIEWVTMLTDTCEFTKYFKPGEVCEVEFKYVPGAKLYAYCNKHSLWTSNVE